MVERKSARDEGIESTKNDWMKSARDEGMESTRNQGIESVRYGSAKVKVEVEVQEQVSYRIG